MRKVTDKELRLITIIACVLIAAAVIVTVSWQWTTFLTRDTAERTKRVKDADIESVKEDQKEIEKVLDKAKEQKKKIDEVKK